MSIDDTVVGVHTCARAISASRVADFGTALEWLTIEIADELIAPHALTMHAEAMADRANLAMAKKDCNWQAHQPQAELLCDLLVPGPLSISRKGPERCDRGWRGVTQKPNIYGHFTRGEGCNRRFFYVSVERAGTRNRADVWRAHALPIFTA